MLKTDALAPTLLEAAGISIPRAMEGRSFWKLLTGEEKGGGCDRIVSLECTWQAKWSLRTEEYKFILSRDTGLAGGPPRELYDLGADPGERHNIVEERPEISASMESELEDWITERLRALGREKDPLVEQGISLRHLVPG
jgi:arylsulfatase A-like enzyme